MRVQSSFLQLWNHSSIFSPRLVGRVEDVSVPQLPCLPSIDAQISSSGKSSPGKRSAENVLHRSGRYLSPPEDSSPIIQKLLEESGGEGSRKRTSVHAVGLCIDHRSTERGSIVVINLSATAQEASGACTSRSVRLHNILSCGRVTIARAWNRQP